MQPVLPQPACVLCNQQVSNGTVLYRASALERITVFRCVCFSCSLRPGWLNVQGVVDRQHALDACLCGMPLSCGSKAPRCLVYVRVFVKARRMALVAEKHHACDWEQATPTWCWIVRTWHIAYALKVSFGEAALQRGSKIDNN